ncbi:cell division protein FtsL [Thermoanaerobacter kivui]|uniref:Cell division protein FtsL n=1 Tax=Thermoanaerobacter kivui TaxID=2325 RepID=A0A097ASC2_THEKI|nr:cell division protein FtsL [Thermoanaerobacter kivui]AIS52714.1 cell division protein FtsL [Thermoanaerobacter kivui]
MIVAQRDYNYEYPPYTSEKTGQVKKSKKKKKLKNLALILFVGSLSVMILFRYAVIYQKSIALDKMEENIRYTENLNQQLKAKIAAMSDPVRIEKIAKDKLGMQQPDESQVVYVNVGKIDTVAKNQKPEDKNVERSNFFMRILGVLNR